MDVWVVGGLVSSDPLDSNTWFDYARLEEAQVGRYVCTVRAYVWKEWHPVFHYTLTDRPTLPTHRTTPPLHRVRLLSRRTQLRK